MLQHQIDFLASQGVTFAPGIRPFEVQPGWGQNLNLAMDAQPQLVTTPNAGVPAFLANLIDPQLITVLFSPMNAAKIFGEVSKGDWTTLSTQFPVVESAGEVTSYGDYNNNGNTSANVNWVPRESYLYQTVTQYGELELERYGLAQIDYKSQLDISSALTMNKFQNRTYFFGVAGLINYGALNDPDLPAPILPNVKTGGGLTWGFNTPAQEIYGDIQKLFQKLQLQSNGLLTMDEKMTLALSPEAAVYLNNVSQYNVSVRQTIRENFPNLRIETAPEYATEAGQLMQMFIDSYEGVETAYCAFNSKMRAHPVIPDLSSFKQKKSGGTWGWIGRRPVFVAQMLGI